MPGRSFAFEPLEQRVLCASIAVNLSQTYQTIGGLGGNYARAKYGDFFIESNDKVGQYTLANLQPKHARVGIPLRGWEPVNDDADPTSMNMAGFATTKSGPGPQLTVSPSLLPRVRKTSPEAPPVSVSAPAPPSS